MCAGEMDRRFPAVRSADQTPNGAPRRVRNVANRRAWPPKRVGLCDRPLWIDRQAPLRPPTDPDATRRGVSIWNAGGRGRATR